MPGMDVTAVFEGGGVRGIALAGAAAAAMERGVRFASAIGTSAGAMVAALVASGYRPGELRAAVCRIDWPGLLDPAPEVHIPVVGKHLALLRGRGFYRGERIEETWSRLLAGKGVATFGDVGRGRLRIVATDLTHSAGVVLPDDLIRYGIDPLGFPVAKAVRMSAAIPFFFQPVAMRDLLTGEKVLFADGAMAANFPIGLAPGGRPSTGFVLTGTGGDHAHLSVRGPASLARAVILAGIRARYSLPRPGGAGGRILEIPASNDLDFDLEPGRARGVFDRGHAAAAGQLERHPLGWQVA